MVYPKNHGFPLSLCTISLLFLLNYDKCVCPELSSLPQLGTFFTNNSHLFCIYVVILKTKITYGTEVVCVTTRK